MPTRRSADSTEGEQLFETAVEQFDAAADLIGLSDNIRTILRSPKNEIIVNFPAEMDDGSHGGDPVGVRHDHLVARPDAQRRQAEMQGPGATRGRDRVPDADMGREIAFQPVEIVVALCAPAVARGIGRVAHFQLRDGWFGIGNACCHGSFSSGRSASV